jgi:hypothetical protein
MLTRQMATVSWDLGSCVHMGKKGLVARQDAFKKRMAAVTVLVWAIALLPRCVAFSQASMRSTMEPSMSSLTKTSAWQSQQPAPPPAVLPGARQSPQKAVLLYVEDACQAGSHMPPR